MKDRHTDRWTRSTSHPFFESGNHDDGGHIVLPDHSPEVVNGRRSRSLRGNVGLGLLVALKS